MRETIAFEALLDGATMPSISALSPSGRHLAYAVEQTIPGSDVNSAIISDEHQHQHQQQRPEGSADDNAAASPSLPRYQVAIASSRAVGTAAAGRAHSKERMIIPSSREKAVDLNTCPVTARVTALQWLDESHLACGLQDGTVTVLVAGHGYRRNPSAEQKQHHGGGRRVLEHGLGRDGAWTPALSRCFHRVHHGGAENKSRVMCIRLSGAGASGAESAVPGGTTRGSEPTVWVLYPDRVLVCVGVEAIVTLARYAGASTDAWVYSTCIGMC